MERKLYLRQICKALRRSLAHKPSTQGCAQALRTKLRTKQNMQAHKTHWPLRTNPAHKPSAQAHAQSQTHKAAHKADLCVHKEFSFHKIQ